jgi:hypothetical protein
MIGESIPENQLHVCEEGLQEIGGRMSENGESKKHKIIGKENGP